MITRSLGVLAAAACMFAASAFADDSASRNTSATLAPACAEAKAAKHVYPHPHKGLIVRRRVKADTPCTVAQPKSFDTSI